MSSFTHASAVTDEQRELVSTARKLLADAACADRLPPAWDTRYPGLNRKLWRSLAELGLLGRSSPRSRTDIGLDQVKQPQLMTT
jgi:alkylation response protein AidB-like acyl-CoA dehydrogenase